MWLEASVTMFVWGQDKATVSDLLDG